VPSLRQSPEHRHIDESARQPIAAALPRLGRDTEAAAIARRVLELQPGFTIASLVCCGMTLVRVVKLTTVEQK
jgi:hypothetical protein